MRTAPSTYTERSNSMADQNEIVNEALQQTAGEQEEHRAQAMEFLNGMAGGDAVEEPEPEDEPSDDIEEAIPEEVAEDEESEAAEELEEEQAEEEEPEPVSADFQADEEELAQALGALRRAGFDDEDIDALGTERALARGLKLAKSQGDVERKLSDAGKRISEFEKRQEVVVLLSRIFARPTVAPGTVDARKLELLIVRAQFDELR